MLSAVFRFSSLLGQSDFTHKVALQMLWQQLEQDGDVPGPRSSHAICAAGGDVYLFGGELEPRVPVPGDVFRYCLETHQWRKLNTLGTHPGPRVAATMAAIESQIFLFGGRTGVEMGDGAQADLLVLDTRTATWSPVTPAGTCPPPRSFHTMAAAGGRLWVFGGCGAGGRLSDLWCFTPTGTATGEWAQLPSCPSLGPRGGAVLAAAPDGSRLWVMGGFNGAELADCHELEAASGTWRCCSGSNSNSSDPATAGKQEPQRAAAAPGKASASAAVIEPMPVGRSVFGAAAHGPCPCHCLLYAYGGEVAPSDKGHAGAGSFSDATLCFSPGGPAAAGGGWRVVEAAGAGPGPRGWFASTAVAANQLLVHGGLGPGNERLGDMHLLTLH